MNCFLEHTGSKNISVLNLTIVGRATVQYNANHFWEASSLGHSRFPRGSDRLFSPLFMLLQRNTKPAARTAIKKTKTVC